MQKIFLSFFIAASVSLLFAACGGTSTNVNVNTNANRTNSYTNSNANSNSNGSTLGNMANSVSNAVSSVTTTSPESFLKEAAQGGLAEVDMGKMASTNAQDADVKAFGKMMVDDHSKANNELMELAKKKNITIAADDIGSHKSTVDKLKGLKGADFDKEYVEEMVDDHESDVSAFQKQADNSSDPDVKAFAAKTLPVLKKHLDRIKEIQAKMKK